MKYLLVILLLVSCSSKPKCTADTSFDEMEIICPERLPINRFSPPHGQIPTYNVPQ